ncbi:MAG TPA: hypothetical protein VEB69_06375 [Acidimicrobiia bacterium]|nr:hypothetical protein [Acidimicrobiia bacterium]
MENRPDPDPDLASELRQGAGREWSEEAAEDERLTELHRQRRLTLADRAKEFVNRGNRVSVEFSGHTFGGAVVAAGEDYVTIEGPGQTADIRLAAARWSILPGDRSEATGVAGAESFRALLHEHSASRHTVRLALPGGDMVIGALAVIAEDHVEVDDVDHRRLIVPYEMILGVVRSSDLH